MNQEEITEIYNTLAPMAGDYANAQAEQIGQAQRSMGTMASNVMGQSQTSGLGNYTYNRLMRPQVDVMRDQLQVQGYTNQLNRLLSDSLSNAQRSYNRHMRSRSYGGYGGSGGGNGGGGNGTNLPTGKEYTGGGSDAANNAAAAIDTVSTLPSTAKQGEYNVGSATVNGETRIVTKEADGRYHIQGVGSYRSNSQPWEDAKKKYNVNLNPYPGSSFWTTI